MELGIRMVILRMLYFLCAISMIVFLYNLANRPRVKDFIDRHPILVTLSGYCYGVYIYHQFILKYLYYDTAFTQHLPLDAVPWISFGVVLALSLVACHLTLKFKFGKWLIG